MNLSLTMSLFRYNGLTGACRLAKSISTVRSGKRKPLDRHSGQDTVKKAGKPVSRRLGHRHCDNARFRCRIKTIHIFRELKNQYIFQLSPVMGHRGEPDFPAACRLGYGLVHVFCCFVVRMFGKKPPMPARYVKMSFKISVQAERGTWSDRFQKREAS